MEQVLRENFGSTCETYSPSEGSCDLFVSATQRWIGLKEVREVAKQNRWTYEVVLEGGQTRVRFMMGSSLWDLDQRSSVVVANATIKHALDNGLLFPGPICTRTEHAGTTETVHIEATPGKPTRVSVPLAEALLDRSGVLNIRLAKGSASIVCTSRKHRVTPAAEGHGVKPHGRVEARIQRRLAKILRGRVRGSVRRTPSVRSDPKFYARAAKSARRGVSGLPRRSVSCSGLDDATAAGAPAGPAL